MAANSIDDVNYDEAMTKQVVAEEVQGQPQSAPREPDAGKVQVSEVSVQTDTVILDPNHPLAVQVPEGIGATATDRPNPLAEALDSGTAEEQFASASKPGAKPAPVKKD